MSCNILHQLYSIICIMRKWGSTSFVIFVTTLVRHNIDNYFRVNTQCLHSTSKQSNINKLLLAQFLLSNTLSEFVLEKNLKSASAEQSCLLQTTTRPQKKQNSHLVSTEFLISLMKIRK